MIRIKAFKRIVGNFSGNKCRTDDYRGIPVFGMAA